MGSIGHIAKGVVSIRAGRGNSCAAALQVQGQLHATNTRLVGILHPVAILVYPHIIAQNNGRLITKVAATVNLPRVERHSGLLITGWPTARRGQVGVACLDEARRHTREDAHGVGARWQARELVQTTGGGGGGGAIHTGGANAVLQFNNDTRQGGFAQVLDAVAIVILPDSVANHATGGKAEVGLEVGFVNGQNDEFGVVGGGQDIVVAVAVVGEVGIGRVHIDQIAPCGQIGKEVIAAGIGAGGCHKGIVAIQRAVAIAVFIEPHGNVGDGGFAGFLVGIVVEVAPDIVANGASASGLVAKVHGEDIDDVHIGDRLAIERGIGVGRLHIAGRHITRIYHDKVTASGIVGE